MKLQTGKQEKLNEMKSLLLETSLKLISLANIMFKKKTQIISTKHECRGYHYKFYGHK